MKKALLAAVNVCVLAAIGYPVADTLTVTDITDTYIVMNQDSTPEHLPMLVVEGYDCSACIDQRALLQIDLSALAGTVKIDKAELQLYSPSQPRPGSGIVRVYKMNKHWIPAEANWYNATAGAPWSSAGGDFDATPYATLKYGNQVNVWHSYDVTTLIQEFKDKPDSNFGIMLKMDPMMLTVTYASANATSAALRPKLVITYSPLSVIGSRILPAAAGLSPVYSMSRSQLSITFSNDQTHSVRMGMLDGRMFFNRQVAGRNFVIPLSNIVPGFYVIQTSGQEGLRGRTFTIDR